MRGVTRRAFGAALSGLLAASMFAAIPASVPAEEATVQDSVLPVKFDLRDRGVVTPVKWQNPWGSCWSFGGIAAAESSILSTMGMTCDQYRAMTGHDFDLSEKHLIWYALHPVTEATNAAQAGEGLYPNGIEGRHAAYSAGGESYLVAGLFSAGIGPVNEDAFPYRGKEGFTEKEFVTKDEYKERALEVFGSEEAYQAERTKQLNKTYGAFSANDDWTIDEFNEAGETNRDVYSGYTLVNGNHLPEYAVKDGDGKWTGYNPDSMAAVKSELYAGRGVSGAFCADDALPDQETSDKGYMDPRNWAHYTDKDGEAVTHCLCIVGWDDNYPKENFADGHEPPENGAWIVKNSWGSETEFITLDDGQTIGNKPWGVTDEEGKHTGYFYLSYYDKSLTSLETMEFATDLYDAGGDMSVWMYDYLPSNYDAMKMQEDSVIRTANVFPNASGRSQTLQAVSTKTAYPNASVTYSMYRLGEDAKNPEDGELLGTKTASYAYAGYHREALDGSIVLKDGERLSVVATETSKGQNGETKYDVAASNARTKASATEINDGFYGVSKVNKGESFIYRNGAWADWTESDLLPEFNEATQNMFVTDNFSIKAYMVAQDEPEPAPTPAGSDMFRLYNPYTGEHFYTASAYERDVLVGLGWQDEGVGWTAPEEGAPVYRLYNPYAGDHHYTMSAYERDELVKVGWLDEGIGWRSAGEDGVPVLRQYNPYASVGTHNYTTSAFEAKALVGLGWQDEGVGWYAL